MTQVCVSLTQVCVSPFFALCSGRIVGVLAALFLSCCMRFCICSQVSFRGLLSPLRMEMAQAFESCTFSFGNILVLSFVQIVMACSCVRGEDAAAWNCERSMNLRVVSSEEGGE